MNIILALVPLVAFLGLLAFCANRDSKVTPLYKRMGIFGRFKAYMAIDFTFAGAMLFVFYVFEPVMHMVEIKDVRTGYLAIAGSVVLFGIGCMIYASAYMKCPKSLKKRVIFDMTAVGWGVTVKLMLFFLPFVWKLADPRTVIYMPQKLKNCLTGKIYTLKDTYDTFALYKDESGIPLILDGIKENGIVFETNQGLFERA